MNTRAQTQSEDMQDATEFSTGMLAANATSMLLFGVFAQFAISETVGLLNMGIGAGSLLCIYLKRRVRTKLLRYVMVGLVGAGVLAAMGVLLYLMEGKMNVELERIRMGN